MQTLAVVVVAQWVAEAIKLMVVLVQTLVLMMVEWKLIGTCNHKQHGVGILNMVCLVMGHQAMGMEQQITVLAMVVMELGAMEVQMLPQLVT